MLNQVPTTHPTELHLLAAEQAESLAWQRLDRLRRAAFFGGTYDSEAYDQAVLAYQAAQRATRAAWRAWWQWHQLAQQPGQRSPVASLAA